MARAVERTQNTKGWHQWLMAGRLAEGKAEIAMAKGDHAEAARLAQDAIDQSRQVRRASMSWPRASSWARPS